jgi:hypothetical protein
VDGSFVEANAVGMQATAARISQETVAAQNMLARFRRVQEREPESLAADTTYCNGEFLQWLADRSITPYMRTRDSVHRKNRPFYGPEHFTYQPESNSYLCPAGQQLNYGGRSMRNRTYAYMGTRKRCGGCALKPQCTSGAFRFLAIHMDEPARQHARELANTPAFANAQQKKKVEALLAELKNQIGLRACACGDCSSCGRSSSWPQCALTVYVLLLTALVAAQTRFLTSVVSWNNRLLYSRPDRALREPETCCNFVRLRLMYLPISGLPPRRA